VRSAACPLTFALACCCPTPCCCQPPQPLSHTLARQQQRRNLTLCLHTPTLTQHSTAQHSRVARACCQVTLQARCELQRTVARVVRFLAQVQIDQGRSDVMLGPTDPLHRTWQHGEHGCGGDSPTNLGGQPHTCATAVSLRAGASSAASIAACRAAAAALALLLSGLAAGGGGGGGGGRE
jgi:hypothetical protein